MKDDISDLKTAVAKLETAIQYLSHDIKNLDQKLDAFVPRREFDASLLAHDVRIKKLEDNQTWLSRLIISAWIAGVVTVATIAKKFF